MEDVVRETIEDILRRKWRAIKRSHEDIEREIWPEEDVKMLKLIEELLDIFE